MDYQNRREEYSWLFLLGGLAVGALAMFVVDPSQGSRRRSNFLLQNFGRRDTKW